MEFAQPRNCMLNGKGFALIWQIFLQEKQMLKTHLTCLILSTHAKTLDALFVLAMFRKKSTPHVLFLELYMFIASKKNPETLNFVYAPLIGLAWKLPTEAAFC